MGFTYDLRNSKWNMCVCVFTLCHIYKDKGKIFSTLNCIDLDIFKLLIKSYIF